MPVKLSIPFPSEAEDLRKQVDAEQSLTPNEKLLALDDLLDTVSALSDAGGMRAANRHFQDQAEQDWRQRMMEFIKQHVHGK